MMQTEKEYAEALFMLAAEEQKTEEYSRSLGLIRSVVQENPTYPEFLASPAIPLSERLAALDEAFGDSVPEYVLSFLKLLCENGRIRLLEECIAEFEKLSMAFSNRIAARVFSAIPLDEDQKQALCAKLEKISGKIVEPEYTVDPSLIGGIKIEIEGKTYDGSIKHRLYDVKDVMIG